MIQGNISIMPMAILLFVSIYTAPVLALGRPLNTLTETACEGKTLNINCANGAIKVIRANYGRQSQTECNLDGRAPIRTIDCVSKNSLAIVNSKCNNQQSCSIQATNSIFGDPCDGTFKYLEVVYQCILTNSASKQEISCEGSALNIRCDSGYVIDVIRANYGRQSARECNSGQPPIRTLDCVSKNSLDIVNAKCDNQQTCSIQATNSIFGDPCVGTYKYLDVAYQCIIPKPPVKNAVACESSNLSIKCERGEEVLVLQANYGRKSSKICIENQPRPTIRNTHCVSQNSKAIVNSLCLGKRQCNIPATNNVFQDPCDGTFKYLEVDYICIKRH